jgi:hypothetical protein
LSALTDAEAFVHARPADEFGCLYWSTRETRFLVPASGESLTEQGITLHFGRPGGVLPRVADASIRDVSGTDTQA